MKANHRRHPTFAIAAALAILLAGSCTEKREAPRPAPVATPTPTPRPVETPQVDWREAPITPGDWRWGMEGGQSVARFAGDLLVLRCDIARRAVILSRAGNATGEVPMTITTQSITKPLLGMARAGSPPSVSISFSAHDPLLDAMAFSRGRFAIATAGLSTLYVPSWPEISRVIEDCR